jgi:hypothetical protein
MCHTTLYQLHRCWPVKIYSLRIFFFDVSDRFEKIKEPVNLPKYPRDSFTRLRSSSRPSRRRVPCPVVPPLPPPSSSPHGAASLASSSTSSPSPDTGGRGGGGFLSLSGLGHLDPLFHRRNPPPRSLSTDLRSPGSFPPLASIVCL